jgi:hypothetical protein
MLTNTLALRKAWDEVLTSLKVEYTGGSVILGGPLAERFGDAIPFAVADEVAGLVSLGDGPILNDDATVVASGLPTGSVDAVVMIDAWRSHAELRDVTSESRRIARTGGKVWLGDLDVEGLVNAMASRRTSALFYAPYGRAIGVLHEHSSHVASTELALLRGAFDDIEVWPTDLPIAAFGTIDAYIEAVSAGMWPGVDVLTSLQWSDLEEEIRRSLGDLEAPYIEHQPWLMASGIKSER